MIKDVTPLILTFNEAPNLRRTLERLKWAKEVVLLDSGSTDDTLAIASVFPNVRVVRRVFDNHTAQWNFGISLCQTNWIFSLDADYIVPQYFAEELAALEEGADFAAYFARFRYCVFGRPLRSTLYPARAVLFQKDYCRYVADGHTQRLQIQGNTGFLSSVIDHDDRKSLSRWLWAQDRYALLEAKKLDEATPESLRQQDKLRRKIIIAPAVVFFYTLLVKRLILDGWPGWYYVFQRTLAEIILSLRLIEIKMTAKSEVKDS